MIIHDRVYPEWERNPYCGYHPSDDVWKMSEKELFDEYIRLDEMELDYESEVYAWERQKYIKREAKNKGYDIMEDVKKYYEGVQE